MSTQESVQARHLNGANGISASAKTDTDAIVIGAGFGGIRMLYELHKQGLSARVFEAGSGVGGTWYWNRYPGARTDSESWVYIFTFLEEIGMEWTWKERFPRQNEVEEYLNKVVDFLDLRKEIQFSTRITSAHRDEHNNAWNVATATGEKFTCKYLFSATGPLATPLKPPYAGLDSFKGEYYLTGLWPKHKVEFAGKRVGLIGTGATGVQILPIIAHNAKSVTVFQRTPNYVLPGRNHPLGEEQTEELKRDSKRLFERARNQIYGFDIPDTTTKFTDMKTDREIQRILEGGWEKGAFRYVFETFSDMLTDEKSNEAASEFIRNKIRTIVKDPETAELLCPNYPFVSKRPPVGHHYYEAFNRETVQLVDIKTNPIKEITTTGLRTDKKEYEFDILIFAIGFDAVTGTLGQIDIRGTGQQSLKEVLAGDLQTAYGIMLPSFPNFFMIFGPQVPFANVPLINDTIVDWIGKTLAYMKASGYDRIESGKEVAKTWSDLVDMIFNMTVIKDSAKETSSWMVGANVEGKTKRPLFFFGGVPMYIGALEKELQDGHAGFEFSKAVEVR